MEENNNPQKEEKKIKSNKWTNILIIALLVAIFIMVAFCLHYLWKLSDIWQAVKNSKPTN